MDEANQRPKSPFNPNLSTPEVLAQINQVELSDEIEFEYMNGLRRVFQCMNDKCCNISPELFNNVDHKQLKKIISSMHPWVTKFGEHIMKLRKFEEKVKLVGYETALDIM